MQTETERLLSEARAIAQRQAGSDSPDLVLAVFCRLCEEQDRQRQEQQCAGEGLH